MLPLAGTPTEMSRPTQENVEDNVLTWQRAIYELHREINKLDQELGLMRLQVADRNALALDAHRYRYIRNIYSKGPDLADAIIDSLMNAKGPTP